MRDVNGSNFHLLADPADWFASPGMRWTGEAFTLAGQQVWRLANPPLDRAAALVERAKHPPVVVDEYGAVARIDAAGTTVESLDAGSWTPLLDIDGGKLAPKIGKFVAMALGGARLALLSGDGVTSFLQLFDLRGRWPLDTPENPSLPVSLDLTGTGIAAAPDGPIFVLTAGGVALFEGGPIEEFVTLDRTSFVPAAGNPHPLRLVKTIEGRPGGAPVGMTVDAARLAILLDVPAAPQTVAFLDRATGLWTSAPVAASTPLPLPFMTDIALLEDGQVALMAPTATPGAPVDCAVVTVTPGTGVALAPYRYPMLNQFAPRFAAVPGPDVYYLGLERGQPAPRRLVPLPYPAYQPTGALGRFDIDSSDPDLVWHRLYAEAALPAGTGLTVWARAAEQSWADTTFAALEMAAPGTDATALAAHRLAAEAQAEADRTMLLTIVRHADPGMVRIGALEAAAIAATLSLTPTPSILTGLGAAPLHRQPPLVLSGMTSELPFHPGLGGGLHELLLQRANGANRRLTGAFLDLIVTAPDDGRHSPCLHAIRVYTPRFSYQDQYLPRLFHQTELADETGSDGAASPPDFRERLLASLEGILTPIETRAAAAESLLDPYAAPAPMLPWLGSYLGLDLDPGWPEARTRRALAMAGTQLRQRGTYRGVCLALDIATGGAVARGEVVVLQTHRLRRTDATILGIPLGGLNVLTAHGTDNGNSIVGDTLILSARRALDVLALVAPETVPLADETTVARFLDEYADRVQVAAILHGPTAPSLRQAVTDVLQAELPAHLNFEVVVSGPRFIVGLSPLLDIDTFLDPPEQPMPLRLDTSTIGRDAVIRDPAAFRP